MTKFDWNHPYVVDYISESRNMLRYWKFHIPIPEKSYNQYYGKLHQLRRWLDEQGYRMSRPKY